MTFSRKEQWIIFGTMNGLFVLVITLFPVYLRCVPLLPIGECLMVDALQLYCPACGGTRAFRALMHFDILSSIKYNPIVVIGAVLFVIYEVVMIKGLVSGKERECFLRPWWLCTVLGTWITYAIVRDVLLFYGIDIIGSILV